MDYKEKYGPWGIVAGGASNAGQAGEHCNYLAKEGLNVVVIDNNDKEIIEKCKQLEADYGIQTRTLILDLGRDDAADIMIEATKDLDIGFFVYNAGIATAMEFVDCDVEYEKWRLNVNARSMLFFTIHFAKLFKKRQSGAIMLTSSLAGVVGSPYVATYAATKAYVLNLAESLFTELKRFGVDVLGIIPGNTRSALFQVPEGTPGFMTGKEVVYEAHENLGKVPSVIVGQYNRDLFKDVYDIQKRMAVHKFRAEEIFGYIPHAD